MYFEEDNELAANRLDFKRVGDLLERQRYVWDEPSEAYRLVNWVRGMVRTSGEHWVWSNRDRLIHEWMQGTRFTFELSKNQRIRIVEELKKEGRIEASSEWSRKSLGRSVK